MKRTFAVYELSHGQPGRFWVSTGSFTPDIKKATLYTEKEATMVMKKLMQPRMANYQKTGKEYTELHIGDVYKKGLMENSIEKLRSVIREEIARLSEGKTINGLQASFDYFEEHKGNAGEVFEHNGGKLVSLGKGDPLKLFKGKVVPELRQAFASNMPVVGLDTKEASKVKRGDALFGFKIGRDLFYIFK